MAKKQNIDVNARKCKECSNCHSHYNKSITGEFILGICDVLKHSVLLTGNECRDFKLKR